LNTICNTYHYLYNYRNLPVTVKLVNNVEVSYTYDAEGTKLTRKIKQGNGATQQTSYEGSFVYQTDANNKLALSYFAHTQGGRVTVTNNQYKYEYFIGDHLGNVRATFGADQNGNLDILQTTDYYPFGLTMAGNKTYSGQEYQYGGKEWQNATNVYDFHARQYNPALGRWFNQDPMMEKYTSVSPYNYCLNNPMNMVDPDGMYSRWGTSNSELWYRATWETLGTGQDAFALYQEYQQVRNSMEFGGGGGSGGGGGYWRQTTITTVYSTDWTYGYYDVEKIFHITGFETVINRTHTHTISQWVNIDLGLNTNVSPPRLDMSALRNSGGDIVRPSNKQNNYRYDHPESDFTWVLSAIVGGISTYNEAQYAIELSNRLSQLQPFSININTGEALWANPKLLKTSKWAGFAGTSGDVLNMLGILYNIRNEGWTTVNTLDFAFGVVGFYPIYGDAAALWYMGVNALVKTEGFKTGCENGSFINSPAWKHCFAEGTKVLMGDRTTKKIEDVLIGDSVLTFNFTNKKLESNIVIYKINAVDINLIKVIFSNNEEVISTENHPYYVKGKGWCSFNPEMTYQSFGFKVGKIEISDICLTPTKKRLRNVKIIQINKVDRTVKTYNLSKIANSNNYFVNGILVNNENETR